jgi:DNA polymerase III delta prime subunit
MDQRPHNQHARRDIFNIKRLIGNITIINNDQQSKRSRDEQKFLEWVKQEQVGKALSIVHTERPIALRKQLQPKQVSPLFTVASKAFGKPPSPLPELSPILEIFDRKDIAGKLLILGEPGSGKTITLLELAQSLIQRAEANSNFPIPILFNLSFWNPRQSIPDWLVEQLQSYGVGKKLGKTWVDNCQLLPLLDGLDEVKPKLQASCVQTINQWLQKEYRLRLVVCSRREEYEKAVRGQWQENVESKEERVNSTEETRLHLNGAILLQALTDDQIQEYLAAVNQSKLWQTLRQDSDLLELVKTPLFLQVLGFIAAENQFSIQDWKSLPSIKTRLQYLFDAYWEAAMERELINLQMRSRGIKSQSYGKRLFPDRKQTKHWLTFLARQLQQESQTEFLIERMQPSWLGTKQKIWHYRLTFTLIFVLTFVLLWELPFFLGNSSKALIGAWFGGVTYGFLGGLSGNIDRIQPVEIINFYWEKAYKAIVSQKWLILPITLLAGLGGFQYGGLVEGLFAALHVSLFFMLLFGLIGGLSSSEIEVKTCPNQGIWKSVNNVARMVLVGGVPCFFWGSFDDIQGFTQTVLLFITFGLTFGLIFAGGRACFKHLALRLMLFRNDFIPWNYARFLDYCTDRLLLQRIGGRYRFMHKLLQDHFAAMGSKE